LICNISIPLILITLWEFCLPMAQLYYQGERWWFFFTWIIEGERRRMSPAFFLRSCRWKISYATTPNYFYFFTSWSI
jgi:hypothetical protein